MRPATDRLTEGEHPHLLVFLAVTGLLGCASLILGTLAAQMIVPGHDWIADTISDLGAGRWEIVMDVALYGFAAGLFATSLAATHAHLGRAGWSTGVVSLALLAALVVVVGARNEYGDSDNEGVVIHIYLVYGLGALFLLLPLVMRPALERDHPRSRAALLVLALLWAIVAPVFLFVPTGIDGLVERLLGLIAVGIVGTLCIVFLRRGLQGLRAG